MKRELRGCDRETEETVYEWAPNQKRCPKTMLTDEVMERIGWWQDWQRFGCFPYGTSSVMTEPAVVYDVLMICDETYKACLGASADG